MRKIIVLLLVAALFAVGCTPLEESNSSKEEGQASKEDISVPEESKEISEAVQESNDGSASVSVEEETGEITVDDTSEESVAQEIQSYEYTIDIEKYWEYINATNLLLVNKENRIDDSFSPEDLVDITYTRGDRSKEKMNRTAEMALRAFLDEAYALGYDDVTVTSGYRSYSKQESLYNYYISQEMGSGKSREEAIAAVNKYSAIPGTSEHHTGLCVDMHNLSSAQQSFGKTEAGKWLAANAHHFGFILRYPADKVDITGYMYEPWHFRFVGREHATAIYLSGMSLEEYVESIGPNEEIGQEVGA